MLVDSKITEDGYYYYGVHMTAILITHKIVEAITNLAPSSVSNKILGKEDVVRYKLIFKHFGEESRDIDVIWELALEVYDRFRDYDKENTLRMSEYDAINAFIEDYVLTNESE